MTASLEQQLQQVRKQLADVQAEYRDFAYIVSHDLSAPFRAIEGFASMIVEDHADELDERTMRRLNTIIKSADKGKAVLEGLLTYSRLNTAAEPFGVCDLNACLLEAVNDLEESVSLTGARIEQARLPEVVADSNQLKQAFYQLLKNGLVFQPAGARPVLSVSFCEDDSYVYVTFLDNGIGVPVKAVDKIFKPCRRFVKDRDFPGEGMGLAIVKKVAERHEGSIRVEQPESPGAMFVMSLSKKLTNEQ